MSIHGPHWKESLMDSAATPNYYSVLGVLETATAAEIKVRYRFLSQAYHPDKFASDAHRQIAEHEFKRINAAYQVLSNPIQRALFDASRTRTSPPPKREQQPWSEYDPPPARNATTRQPHETEQPPHRTPNVSAQAQQSIFGPAFLISWILMTIGALSYQNEIFPSVFVSAVFSLVIAALIDVIASLFRK
ncbi:MAG: J domain-containing protein [Chthoniobacteraceae bacterium]